MLTIRDEPTVEQINEALKSLHIEYATLAFRAMLKKDNERAAEFLRQIKRRRLQDIELSCRLLEKLAKDIFFEAEQQALERNDDDFFDEEYD